MVTCAQPLTLIPPEGNYIFGVLNLVIGFAAFSGNLIVFILIWRTPSLRKKSNCSLVSLALTDFIVGFVLEPMHLLQYFFEKFRGDCMFNSIRRIIAVILIGASISSIAFISYDRYIQLSRRMHNYNENMSKQKIKVILFIVWFIPICMPFLRLIGEDVYGAFFFSFVSSNFVIMLVCYICIIRVVRAKQREMDECSEDTVRSERRRIKHLIRAGKAVSLIIICFFVGTTPISIHLGISSLQMFLSSHRYIAGFYGRNKQISYAFSMSFAMANSAINPIIYYARHPGFKESLAKLFRDIKGIHTSQGNEDTTTSGVSKPSETDEIEVR